MVRLYCVVLLALLSATTGTTASASPNAIPSHAAAQLSQPRQLSLCEFKALLSRPASACIATASVLFAEPPIQTVEGTPCCETCYTLYLQDITTCRNWAQWGWPSYSACRLEAWHTYEDCKDACWSWYGENCNY